jgi:hypothetical protein
MASLTPLPDRCSDMSDRLTGHGSGKDRFSDVIGDTRGSGRADPPEPPAPWWEALVARAGEDASGISLAHWLAGCHADGADSLRLNRGVDDGWQVIVFSAEQYYDQLWVSNGGYDAICRLWPWARGRPYRRPVPPGPLLPDA